ncbi:MAG: sulfatase-like hydrolase/transferase, partial [Spirochaetales bacterium]|nr:sulfatase-like hydrolase/transferase [Spirochaetales bacterium]
KFRHDVDAPNIDRLRAESITFSNAFCQTPTCCPSRGSVFTGKYPQQLGLYNHSCLLSDSEKTMGHHFSEHGYDAVAFGKTHHMNPGFRSITYDVATSMGSKNHGYNVTDSDAVGVFEGPVEEFCDFAAVRQFTDYLETGPDKFLAYIGIYSPHPPLYPPKKYLEMYDWRDISLPPVFEEETTTKPEIQGIPRKRWSQLNEETHKKITAAVMGMSTLVDDCVGGIVEALEDRGLLEDTVIVFTSDHGDQIGEHGMLGKFYNTYEGSLRVPLILRIPSKTEGAEKSRGVLRKDLVELVDVYPTLCSLAGVPAPEPPHGLAGGDLLESDTGSGRTYVHSMIEHAHMVRDNRFKLTLYDNDRSELYDVQNDPDERSNLHDDPGHMGEQLRLTSEIVRHLTRFRPANHNPGRNTFFG